MTTIHGLKFEEVEVDFNKSADFVKEYDVKEILEKAYQFVENAICSKCKRKADKVDHENDDALFCNEHADEEGNKGTFSDLQVEFSQFSQKINMLYSEIVRAFCIQQYAEVENIKNLLFRDSYSQIQETATNLEEMFGVLLMDLKEKSGNMTSTGFSDMVRIGGEIEQISSKLHQLIGLGIAKYMSSEMFKKVSQTSINETEMPEIELDGENLMSKKSIPYNYLNKIFKFLSLFVQERQSVEESLRELGLPVAGNLTDSEEEKETEKDRKIRQLESEIEDYRIKLSEFGESGLTDEQKHAHHHKAGVRITEDDDTELIMKELITLKRFTDNGKLDENSALAIW
jgi:hypothetical protein